MLGTITSACNYCSVQCFTRGAIAAVEENNRQIQDCPHCAALNNRQHSSSSGGHSGIGTACASQACQGPNCKRICCRPGKITNNSFFNFVRTRRPAHCGEKQTVLVQEAARTWNGMTSDEKSRYTKRAVRNNRNA